MATPCASPAPAELKAESRRVASALSSAGKEENWIDSAKKELGHLDNIWTKVLSSPNRKYSLDYKKKSLALRTSGFTVAPTPPPLRRFRKLASSSKENDEEAVPVFFSPSRSNGRKSKPTSAVLKPKIAKRKKKTGASARAALAEQKFKSRLLKTRRANVHN